MTEKCIGKNDNYISKRGLEKNKKISKKLLPSDQKCVILHKVKTRENKIKNLSKRIKKVLDKRNTILYND